MGRQAPSRPWLSALHTRVRLSWMSLGVLRPSRRARSVNTRITLATTKKHQLSVSDYYAKMLDYYAKMSQLVDDLAALGTPLRDDEFAAYLLTGLDEEYNPVFTTVMAWVDPISSSDLYAQLLSFEQHTTLQVAASRALWWPWLWWP
jgi:hypothetical protein